MARAKVSGLEGRTKISDEEILKLWKRGWFLDQIRKKHIIGYERLKKMTRAQDAKAIP
jgi:hypothetical protein